MTDLTINEVVAAIREATKPNDDGYATRAEIQAKMGGCAPVVCARLKRLLADGRLSVRKVLRPALDGRMMPVAAYKLLRKK